MKTNAPKKITWIIAVVLGVVGIAGRVVPIGEIAPHAFWLVTASFVTLALGSVLKDL
jgi:hypothetical protein